MRTFAADLAWAIRLAGRRPAAAAAVLSTLALAIGAAAIAFGVSTAVLWTPLLFRDADRLVFVWETVDADGGPQPRRVTSGRYTEWQDRTRSFSSIAAFGAAGFTIADPSGAVPLRAVRVTAGYFDTLGLAPLLGRTFSRDDEEPGRHFVTILSHALWRERFGGDPAVVGRTLLLSGQPYTVIGVMPPAVLPAWPVNPATVTLDESSRQLWVPVPSTPAFAQELQSHLFGVIARLTPGVSLEQASAELASLQSASAADPHGGVAVAFRHQLVGDARLPLLVLFAATLAVLLVACANLAALQATLLEARRGELSTRLALGAGRGRLARQLLAESMLLALAGGAAGLALARAGLSSVPQLLPSTVPLLTTPGLDARVVVFALTAAAAAGLVLTLWPLGKLAGVELSPRGVSARPRTWVYRGVVIGQIAATVALTVSAALLTRSLSSVRARDAGFVVDGVTVTELTVPGSPTAREAAAFEQQVLGRAANITGVTAVAAAYDHPLEANWTDAYTLVGADRREPGSAQLRIVSPGYHAALGVEILDGRALSDRDDLDAPGAALVNEAFARTLSDGPVIGRMFLTSAPAGAWGTDAPHEYAIVGVVENERVRGMEATAPPAIYLSTRQFPQQGFVLIVRSTADPRAVAAAIRPAVGEIDRAASVAAPRTLSSILDEQLVTRWVTTTLVSGLSGAALALSALGVYGLLAVMVSGRTREIGLRIALGAPPGTVGRDVVWQSVANGAAGVGAGLVLAAALGRVIESLLVGVTAHDPATLVAVAAVMLFTTAAAAIVPARRAERIDAVTALKE